MIIRGIRICLLKIKIGLWFLWKRDKFVNYEFEKSDGEFWVGKYVLDGNRGFKGKARCRINFDWDIRDIISLRRGG